MVAIPAEEHGERRGIHVRSKGGGGKYQHKEKAGIRSDQASVSKSMYVQIVVEWRT